MWQFFRLVRQAFSRKPGPRRVRPLLDPLEDRTVPTTLIQPNFPGESVVSGGKTAVDATTVYVLFEGAYWNTPAGMSDQTALTADVQTLLDPNDPYLSGLAQYTASGNNVQAKFGAAFKDPTQLAPNFAPVNAQGIMDWTPLNARLQSAFNNPNSGIPASGTPTPTYILVTDPKVDSGSPWTGSNDSGMDVSFRRQVYLRTQLSGSSVDLNEFTTSLSHELVESLSGSVQVQQPAQFALSGGQIADGEPNTFSPSGTEYAFKVNGILVQAYWSDRDKAFLIPDGNAQTTTLMPVWNRSTFTGQFNTVMPNSGGDGGSHHTTDHTGQSSDSTGGGSGSEGETPGDSGGQHRHSRGRGQRGHQRSHHGRRQRHGHRGAGR